jgi:predicted nucleic acid-binding protein
VLDYENDNNPYEIKRNAIAPWKKIAEDYCASSNAVILRGKKIMELGINDADALHISCAIEKNCDYFITADTPLTRKNIEGIKIVNPIDFVREMEEKS